MSDEDSGVIAVYFLPSGAKRLCCRGGCDPARPVAAPVTAATRTYVVQPGDSVYRIAERVYGDAEQWKKIRDANKDHLGPGNQVRAGQVLVIP